MSDELTDLHEEFKQTDIKIQECNKAAQDTASLLRYAIDESDGKMKTNTGTIINELNSNTNVLVNKGDHIEVKIATTAELTNGMITGVSNKFNELQKNIIQSMKEQITLLGNKINQKPLDDYHNFEEDRTYNMEKDAMVHLYGINFNWMQNGM
jgi:hypothetical protein